MGELGSGIKFEGAVKPDSITVDAYEKDLFAERSTEIPSNLQMQCDYSGRADGQPVYLGFGARGLATTDAGWLLHKFTYDGSDRVTVRQIAYDSWASRTTASYA